MEAKSYSMQAPERVAETYGGNKQKIAQAVQMGVIDPTTGLMAGMFIDRMRSAQAQEQAPNQTVAQRVLGPQAPPAPPAGLGATPQGMQMAGGPGPQMAAPPQMIPPAPQGPVRMAVGGLTTLPIPDDMYDEQSFSGGGIVAFSGGGDSETELRKSLLAALGNSRYANQHELIRRKLRALDEGKGGLKDQQYDPYLASASVDIMPEADPYAASASVDMFPEEPINVGPRARAPQSAGDSIYSPGGGGRDYNDGPGKTEKKPAWHGAGRRAVNAAADAPLRMPRSIYELDPKGKLSPLAGGLVTGTVGAVDLARDFGILGARGLRGTAGAAKDVAGGMYDFAFTPRGERSATSTPSASGYKPNLGSVNMGGYDPNRSSFPAPDTGIGALLASQSARADTAPRGERGVARGGRGAPRAPAMATEAAVPATKEETREELQARIKTMMGEVPAPEGTSAEDKAARKNEDLWSALAQIGFGAAAGDSPYALTNIGKGAAAAMPGMQASLKERRADEKEENARMYSYELAKYGVNKDAAVAAMSEFRDLSKQKQDERLALMQDKTARANAQLQADTSRYAVDTQREAPTADMKEFDFIKSLGEADRELYYKFKPPYNPAAGISGNVAANKAALEGLKVLYRNVTTDPNRTPEQKKTAQAAIQRQMAAINAALVEAGSGIAGGADLSGFKVTSR